MKSLFMTAAIMFTANAMAAEKVDYSYCQETFKSSPIGYGLEEGFPFKITDDGNTRVHLKVKSYKKDDKARTETFEYGEKPMKTKVTIYRDESGTLSRVVSSSFFDAPEVKRGVGSKNPGGMYGMGMGIGFGMGYSGMMEPMVDTTTDIVTDIKIQNGKCVPFRSLMDIKKGKTSEKHFVADLQLCRDVKMFFKKNPEAAACFGEKMNNAMEEVLQGHRTRNADLYNPAGDKTEANEGGYPGTGMYPGGSYGGFNAEGMSYNGIAGGYGMFLDNLITEKNTPNFLGSPLARGASVMSYCSMPFGPMDKMIQDEALFAPELAKNADTVQNGISK